MRHLIEPEGNRAVVHWLRENSERPIAAMNLWSLLLARLHHGTGQVLLSRGELAGEVGVTPREITYIMRELDGIGAVSRRPDGSRVRYFLNPKLFVTPQDQEEAGRIPVFEPVESEEEETPRRLPPDERVQYALMPAEDEREAPPWAPEGAGDREDSRESESDVLRGTTSGIWQRWRDRLFPAKEKEDD